MNRSVDVVIVNWNSREQLRECLETVPASCNVIVVDNASTDDSIASARATGSSPAIIQNDRNRGYAAAANAGARAGQAEFILFLNPDVRLRPESIDRALAANRDICGIKLVDDEGRTWRSCARFPKPRHFIAYAIGLDRIAPSLFPSHFMREWDHETSREVDHVIGAFYLVKRPLFEQLGGFDERFFVYLEDLDFSYRASKTGVRAYYLAEASAFHRGGGTSEQVKAKRLIYATRSRLAYARKHFSPSAAGIHALATFVIEPIARLAYAGARATRFGLRRLSAAFIEESKRR